MIKPSLDRLHSPDVYDLSSFIPDDPMCFGFLVQAIFGQEGVGGEESFDFMVCTTAWLNQRVADVGILNGRHYLIVAEYDFEALMTFVIRFAEKCSGENWTEVANKLSRLGKWEFEDYMPYKP